MVSSTRTTSTSITPEIDGVQRQEVANSIHVNNKQSHAAKLVDLYDTTLRDGTQMEGVSASVNDKLKITRELHNFGAFVRYLVLALRELQYRSGTW